MLLWRHTIYHQHRNSHICHLHRGSGSCEKKSRFQKSVVRVLPPAPKFNVGIHVGGAGLNIKRLLFRTGRNTQCTPNIEFGGRGQTSLSHCFSGTAFFSHDPESNQPPFVHPRLSSSIILLPQEHEDDVPPVKTKSKQGFYRFR